MEKLDILVPDPIEDLLNFQRVDLLVSVLEAFLEVRIHCATVLKLFDEVLYVLISSHCILIVDDFETLARFFLDDAVVSATMDALSHLFALIKHGFEHLEVLAWLCVGSDPFQTPLVLFL